MKKFAALLVILFAFCGCAWGAEFADFLSGGETFKKGFELYIAKKYTDAMITFKKAVEEGDGIAAAYIGTLYQDGVDGIGENPPKAIEWYQKSIDMGSPEGVAMMAVLYVSGYDSIPEDPVKGYELIKTVENSDSIIAMWVLADFYTNGWGIERNYQKAREIASRLPDEKTKENVLANIARIEKENTAIPAQALMTEVDQNQMRFDRNYQDKTIIVSGYVGEIKEGDGGYILEVFGETGLVNPFHFIECRCTNAQEEALLNLNKGDAVKVMGTYKGKQQFQLGRLTLFSCEVVK